MIEQAAQIFRFVLSIDLGSGCLNTAWHREKNAQGNPSCGIHNTCRLAASSTRADGNSKPQFADS
jgi:hypothetical protein